MTPEQNKVAGDVCFFLREGEKDVEAIAEVAGCSTGTVYKYRRMLFPENKRKYTKHRKQSKPSKLIKKQIEADFDTVTQDIASKIKALAAAYDADIDKVYLPMNAEQVLTSITDGATLKVIEEHKGHFGVDMVNSPKHYTAGGIETYDFIAAKGLSYELGNVVKYITRADHKGSRLQDLKKAQWYLNAAISREEKSNG
jgi:hypothetical protein